MCGRDRQELHADPVDAGRLEHPCTVVRDPAHHGPRALPRPWRHASAPAAHPALLAARRLRRRSGIWTGTLRPG